MTIKTLAIAAVCIGVSMGINPSVQAATTSKTLFIDPSAACQLSVPTTDTAVRPKATGFRNEGANAFVICGVGQLTNGSPATSLEIQLVSFDGASHDTSCTAVNRQSTGSSPVFSTKVATVTSSATAIDWLAADVGFSGFATSVTCTLPAGVAITGVRLVFPDEIGT